MTSREFSEWRALYRMEPFGQFRDDFRTGILCSTLLGMFGTKADPMEFMPLFREEQKPTTPQDETKAMLAAMGAVKRGDTSKT